MDHRNIFDNYAGHTGLLLLSKQEKFWFLFHWNTIFAQVYSVHSIYPDSEYEAVEIEFYTCHWIYYGSKIFKSISIDPWYCVEKKLWS